MLPHLPLTKSHWTDLVFLNYVFDFLNKSYIHKYKKTNAKWPRAKSPSILAVNIRFSFFSEVTIVRPYIFIHRVILRYVRRYNYIFIVFLFTAILPYKAHSSTTGFFSLLTVYLKSFHIHV